MTPAPDAPPAPRLRDRLNVLALQALPQHLLARAMYRVTRSKWRPWKNLLIRFVLARYDIDMDEAAEPDPFRYPSFNAFFTRALRADARPIDPDPHGIASPVDGRVSQLGAIRAGRLIQAKGQQYDLTALLAGDRELASRFADGSFATLYLSPRDYHRVHMPLSGRLLRMDFVPGELFSVSEATAQLVPGLFARNERIVTLFETGQGPLALVLVGAIFVASMETVWAGEVRGTGSTPSHWSYREPDAPHLEKGAEMGRFNMGSTVILLLPKGVASWLGTLGPGSPVKIGKRLGTLC